MKKLIHLVLLIFSTTLLGNDNSQPCNNFDVFFPYKAGKKAESAGAHVQAFDIYCNLAFKGDYRAQFKLASYYAKGINGYVEKNMIYAWVWAKLSNFHVISRKRDEFAKRLEIELDEKTLSYARKLYFNALHSIPGGARIDMKYEAIDLEKLLSKQNEKKSYTGSRIKSDKPPPVGLGVIQVN